MLVVSHTPQRMQPSLAPGAQLQGPLILEERESTIVVALASDVTIRPDLTVSITIKEFD